MIINFSKLINIFALHISDGIGIFDFDEDEFIAGCEKAIENYEQNPLNENGLKLQKDFTYEKLADQLLSLI